MEIMKLTFQAAIEIMGVNPYVGVSGDRVEQLKPGHRGPMPVLVKVNGVPNPPWHINMMPRGDGGYYLYLAEVVRKASGTKVGDMVRVEVEFDKEYRSGPDELPGWFEMALERDAGAQVNWASLPPSRQKEVVRYLLNLKSDEARARNLERVMAMLSGVEGHYMGRNWRDGK